MKRGKLAGFIIDCETDDLQAAAAFWSDALGLRIQQVDDSGDPQYIGLQGAPGGMHLEVQKVNHPSRVHLDIEADDIEAEVQRLEALGARRVGPVKT